MTNMSEWNQSLGAAIENAAENLPTGYVIDVAVERHGYNVLLRFEDEYYPRRFEGESIIDDIESAVALAVELALP